MPLEREIVPACEVCGASFNGHEQHMDLRDNFHVSQEQFRYVRCGHCGTWLQNPRPIESAMEPFYADELLPDFDRRRRTFVHWAAETFRDCKLYLSEVRWLLANLESGAFYLDYSSGDGEVPRMVCARRPDVSVHVTDFSPTYRDRLARFLDTARIKRDIEDFPQELYFDVISAFGVLEHVYSPRALLERLHARLKPGGVLLLTVPNPESWQRHLSGRRWWCWLAPRHMYLLGMKRLTKLLQEEGFEVLEQRHFLIRYCTLTLIHSFFPSLNPNEAGWLRQAVLLVLYVLLMPFEMAAAAFGRSGFMAVSARKPTD